MIEEQKPDQAKQKKAETEAKGRILARSIEMEQEAQRKALRDDFAKAALTGLLAHHGNPNLRSLADSAFQYADFMMEIRDGGAR